MCSLLAVPKIKTRCLNRIAEQINLALAVVYAPRSVPLRQLPLKII